MPRPLLKPLVRKSAVCSSPARRLAWYAFAMQTISSGGSCPAASIALTRSGAYFSSSGVTNVYATPVLPARPVRPTRCT
eukprot:4618720-Prymnesium_polylepis.3